MTDTVSDGEADDIERIPAAFVEQVRDALEHLFDLGHLQRHPLRPPDERAGGSTATDTGLRLRWELVGAIESLSPGPSVTLDAPQARVYNLLVSHFLECRTVQEAAHQVDISRRQAHRDLHEGIARVAAILWSHRVHASLGEPTASQLSSVEAEIGRLAPQFQLLDMVALLRRALAPLESLARQREVRIEISPPLPPLGISSDPAIAEQVLLSVLSNAVQQSQPGILHLELDNKGRSACLNLRYLPGSPAPGAALLSPVIGQMAERLGWRIEQVEQSTGLRLIRLTMAVSGPRVLVIDDNEGLLRLIERYLTDQTCRVVTTTNGQEGLRLAVELAPDAIILDVMMPGMHGWEILQRLRTHTRTAQIPVIVCSVINDPGLAHSLGASLVLSKPVNREQILQALRQLAVFHPA